MGNPIATPQVIEEHRLQKSALLISAISTNISLLIKCSLLGWIAFETAVVLIAFAGKSTHAELAVSLLGSLTFGRVGAGAVGLGGITWGIAERRLRKRAQTTADDRIKKLEAEINRRGKSHN